MTFACTTIHDVLYAGENIVTFKAGSAVKAGQVVGFEDAGTTMQVVPAQAGTTKGAVVGVALTDAASGAYFTVAMPPCIVYVWEGENAAIDAGDYVMASSTTAGAVKTYICTAQDSVGVVGVALEDNAGNAKSRVLLQFAPIEKTA